MPKDSESTEKISEKPVAKVTFSGTTEDVMKQIKGERDESTPKDKEKEEEDTKEAKKRKTLNAFQDSSNRVTCIRESPTDINGQTLVNEFDLLCPTNLNEVRDRIINEYGGGNWMIQVKDECGEIIGATSLKLKMPPKPVFVEDPTEEDEFGFGESVVVDRKGRRPMNFRFPTKDEREEKEDAMQKMMDDLLLQNKQKLVMDQMYKMMNNGDETTTKTKKGREEADIKDLVTSIQNSNKDLVTALERKFEDKVSLLERSMIESKHEKEMNELRTMLMEKNATKDLQMQIANIQRDFQNSLMSLKNDILKGGDSDKTNGLMFKTLVDSNDKMMAVVNSSLNSKFDSMQASNKDFKDLFLSMHDDKKASTQNPMDATKDLISIAQGLVGLNRPEVEETGPLTTEDRLIKAFTDVTPQVLGFFKDRKNPTEDEIKKAIEERARDIAKGAIAQMKQKQIPADNPAQIENKEPKKIAEKKEDPKVKIKECVNHVLAVLNQEIDIMPMDPEWISHAFKVLPKEELVKLAEAEDVKAMLPVLKEYANPSLMMELGFKLFADSKKVAWLESGLKTLREAVKEAIEAEKNPDSADDDDEEDGEEEAPEGSDGDII